MGAVEFACAQRGRQIPVTGRLQRALVVIATTDVAERVGSADTRLWTDWFEAVDRAAGKRYGVSIRRAGNTVLLGCAAIPDSYYNRVMGLGGVDCERVGSLFSSFERSGRTFRVDMNPFVATRDLTSCLIDRRLYPASFQTSLYAEIDAIDTPPAPSRVTVRPVRDGEIAFFARLYNRSYFPDAIVCRRLAHFREATVVARYGRRGWRHYLAFVDGVPAGGALMYVDGDVATLAGAATMFTMRRRGVQRALLSRRLEDAAAAGCELIVSRCGVGSASQRNMERVGLRTAYTKVVWVRQGAEAPPPVFVRRG